MSQNSPQNNPSHTHHNHSHNNQSPPHNGSDPHSNAFASAVRYAKHSGDRDISENSEMKNLWIIVFTIIVLAIFIWFIVWYFYTKKAPDANTSSSNNSSNDAPTIPVSGIKSQPEIPVNPTANQSLNINNNNHPKSINNQRPAAFTQPPINHPSHNFTRANPPPMPRQMAPHGLSGVRNSLQPPAFSNPSGFVRS